jgi:hypothetical protein
MKADTHIVIYVKWSLKDPPRGENQLSSQISDALRLVSVAVMFFVATVDERMDGRTDGANLIGTARVFGRPKNALSLSACNTSNTTKWIFMKAIIGFTTIC